MMMVKGVAFLARQSMLMQTLGEQTWNNFLAEQAQSEPLFAQPMLPISLIPAEVFLAFNDAAVDRFFNSDRKAYFGFGEKSGEYALREGPLKGMFKPGDFKRFAQFTPSIWKNYYTMGELRASVDGDFADVHTSSPIPHVYFEYTAMGFVKAGLEMLSGKPVEHQIVKAFSRGDDTSHYRFRLN